MQIEYDQLRTAIAETFLTHGVAPVDAWNLGRELADATFAGYESHGIGRVKGYVEALEAGRLRADARLAVVREICEAYGGELTIARSPLGGALVKARFTA